VPASGFYEWRKEPRGGKTPMYIRRRDGRPMAFAGVWETWHSPDGSELPTFTIITTTPNELMKPIHDRMPAILDPEAFRLWLTPGEVEPQAVQPLLRPCPADELRADPVSRLVNNPANDSPACIESASQEPAPAPPPKRRKA